MINCAHLTFSGVFGGREKVAFSLVEALAGQIETRLYLVLEERADATAQSDLLEKLAHYNVSVKVLSTTGIFSYKTLQELADNITKDGAQIVHSHCHKSMMYALLLKYWKGLSLVTAVTLHGLIIPFSFKYLVHHGMNLLELFLMDGIICCSKREVSGVLGTLPLLSKKMTVIRNNLTPAVEVPHEKEIDKNEFRYNFNILPAKKILIGNASRLTKVKNISLYLEMAKTVLQRSQRNDLLFLVAGDGELCDKLKAKADELKLGDSFLFLGFLANMRGFYHALDLFVLTSDSEGTPMAMLEAMSVGLPVVASSVGGIPDIVVDGVTGHLYPKRNLSACADAVMDLILERTKAFQMGAAGKQRILEEFTPERWVKQHLDFYKKFLHRKCGALQ